MTFNCGLLGVINSAGVAGGSFRIDRIDGPTNSTIQVPGLATTESGAPIRTGALNIYHTSSSRPIRTYPWVQKLDNRGQGLFEFLYDAADIPRVVAGPGGLHATNITYSTKLNGSTIYSSGRGQLIHFSNVGHFSRASPHFTTPSVGFPQIDSVISKATNSARRLYAINNSMSRFCLFGIVVL